MNTKAARQRGEEAGNRALARAERADPGWADKAYAYLWLFASHMSREPYVEPWSTEHFRIWAHAKGLPYPPDNRSIGGVVCRAIREGIITPCGFAPTVSSNGSPRRTYKRAI